MRDSGVKHHLVPFIHLFIDRSHHPVLVVLGQQRERQLGDLTPAVLHDAAGDRPGHELADSDLLAWLGDERPGMTAIVSRDSEYFTRRWRGQAVPGYAAEERLAGNAGSELRGLLVPVCMPSRLMSGRSAT